MMGEALRTQGGEHPIFICPLCKRRSYHPADIHEHFCGACGFVDDVIERLLFKRAE